MKLKINWMLIGIMLFGLSGCALPMYGTGNDHVTTPVDRSLIYYNQYMALEATYKNHYIASDELTKKRLSETMAPVLDRMRFLVKLYSKAALEEEDDVVVRVEILQLYRQATLKLAEELHK